MERFHCWGKLRSSLLGYKIKLGGLIRKERIQVAAKQGGGRKVIGFKKREH